MNYKALAIILLTAISTPNITLAAEGSFDKICTERSGHAFKDAYLGSINIGDDDSANVSVGSNWAHIDHDDRNLIHLAKMAVYFKHKVDVCLSDVNQRVLVLQTNSGNI